MKTTAKDFFLNLLAVAALYFSAGFLVNLLFAYIDLAIVDPLQGSAMYRLGSVRWGVAALVVIFPVFVWASWFLNKIFVKNPESRKYKVRIWLLYLTLFIAGGVIVGDLVAVIYNFLEGDLTARFLWKVASILAVSGLIFSYYLIEVRAEGAVSAEEGGNKIQRWLARISMIAIAIAIIAGFFVAGSPFEQRLRRFDDRRVSDLQSIQWQVVNFWQSKERLPDNLDELSDKISGFTAPRDSENNSAYEYRKASDLSFELCATFNREGNDESGSNVPMPAKAQFSGEMQGNWSHASGRACFERTIDPDLYPPFAKP
ncbi:MAG: hypothetical protein HZC14_03595 [Candidatus Niyogibacteria bacterium]|nr:hypothetical protein [Candidatus Niyogibacteria bacterium]